MSPAPFWAVASPTQCFSRQSTSGAAELPRACSRGPARNVPVSPPQCLCCGHLQGSVTDLWHLIKARGTSGTEPRLRLIAQDSSPSLLCSLITGAAQGRAEAVDAQPMNGILGSSRNPRTTAHQKPRALESPVLTSWPPSRWRMGLPGKGLQVQVEL